MSKQTFDRKRLKEAREAAGVSQEKAAELMRRNGIEMSKETWRRREAGDYEPGINELIVIARLFDRPLDFFLSGK